MNEITLHELESESMEMLPERETLFFNTYHLNWANIMASNSSLALNAATAFSAASSNAVQTIVVGQG
jgi:hypothetical protein